MPRRCCVADAVGFGPTEDIAAPSGVQSRRVRPLRQASMENRWCGRPNSNRDARRREVLKLVRLPVPPRPRCLKLDEPAICQPARAMHSMCEPNGSRWVCRATGARRVCSRGAAGQRTFSRSPHASLASCSACRALPVEARGERAGGCVSGTGPAAPAGVCARWSSRTDLNCRPSPCHSAALPD